MLRDVVLLFSVLTPVCFSHANNTSKYKTLNITNQEMVLRTVKYHHISTRNFSINVTRAKPHAHCIEGVDYVDFSKSLDLEKDKDKIKAAIKTFRRRHENVSSEEDLEKLLRPHFRARRNIDHINLNATLPPEKTEFTLFDPFKVFDDIPKDLPSTRNHPEEIKRWMEEVLPPRSKELIVNKTVCHLRALEMLNEDLKRNLSKPFAYYYKEAHIEEVCKIEGSRFMQRLASRSTTEKPKSTKSLKHLRDEIKEQMGTMMDTGSLSGGDEMPSWMVRDIKEKFPDKVNEDGASVHESDVIFGECREKRDVNDKLTEKLARGNEIFKSRLREAMSRNENKTSDKDVPNNGSNKNSETYRLKVDLQQNSMYKRFQEFTINYDDLPKEEWEIDKTTLFSMGDSLEELIQSNQKGDLKHLIGLKSSKIEAYLKSLNDSYKSNNNTPTTVNVMKLYRTNTEILRKTYTKIPKSIQETPSEKLCNQSKKINEGLDDFTKSDNMLTRPFRKPLRMEVFKPQDISSLDNMDEGFDSPLFQLGEAFPMKNLTSSFMSSTEKPTVQLKTNNDSKSELEFKDGLFGLNDKHQNYFGNIDVTKKNFRTTDLRRSAKISENPFLQLKIHNDSNSEMEFKDGLFGLKNEYQNSFGNNDLNSEMEFKDGLFGLKDKHKNYFDNIDETQKFTRTTDIIIKRFAKINTTWQSRLKTKVFKIQGDSDMREHEFDVSEYKNSILGRRVVNQKMKNSFGMNLKDIKSSESTTDIEHKIRKKRSLVLHRNEKTPEVFLNGTATSENKKIESLEAKAQFKKPEFLKAWDAQDRLRYNRDDAGEKLLVDDGTGDVLRLIREQCKESSEEDSLVGKEKSMLKKFKEVEDYGAASMPSQLKPDGGKTDENFNTSFFNEFVKDANKSLEFTLDSTPDADNFDDVSRRFKIRLERLEKFKQMRFQTAGPEYFTMPTEETESSHLCSTRMTTMTQTSSYSTTQHLPRNPSQGITVDSEDIIEGNKEDLERFLNFEPEEEDEPWTVFDVAGMEKFLGKTMSNRNSTQIYKLYRP